MDELTLRAIAKINIGLHITGRRPDGYHLLETLFWPVPTLYDTLRIVRSDGVQCDVEMTGTDEQVSLEQNLVFRAWRALRARYPGRVGGVRVRVEKGIPSGAGLGGGSSDAAAVLRGLGRMFGLPAETATLAEIGGGLGSDVPYFLHERPMFATGTGTELSPFPLSLEGYTLRLTTLPVHSSTVAAYKGLLPEEIGRHGPLAEALRRPVEAWRTCVFNDLEGPVFRLYPEIAAEKEKLYADGAVYAAMTGSGSACFGIFPE